MQFPAFRLISECIGRNNYAITLNTALAIQLFTDVEGETIILS